MPANARWVKRNPCRSAYRDEPGAMSTPRFSLSIDDGHPLDLRVSELLDKFDLNATFYIPISNDEGWPVMDAAQLQSLAQRFEIGSHTLSHRFLTTLDDDAAWRQISEGKQQLEDCLGQPVQGFCYPGGRYRRRHLAMVRAAGFAYARTTQNLRIDNAPAHPLAMPTTLQFYPHPRTVVLRNFVSQRDWAERCAALQIALTTTDWLQRMHRLLDHAVAQGGVFHLWCHSLDLERLELWESFAQFLARVAALLPPAQRVSNGALARSVMAVPPPAAPAVPRCAGRDPTH